MHIKTGTWEASSMVCESDVALYDSAALVSPPKPEPQIRNRRLSPGSGVCGGGGGCGNRVRKPTRQPSPPTPETALTSGRDSEHRAHPKARSLRKEGPRGARAGDRARRDKERWTTGESLAVLRPPPAFPVKDSPAKLQPAVSYASKVKSGGAGGTVEDPPAIGVLLQNQWGLSFISESPQTAERVEPPAPTQNKPSFGAPPCCSEELAIDVAPTTETHTESPPPATPLFPIGQCREEVDSSGELLLGCRHLVEALRYHTQEWNVLCSKQKRGSATVIWYKNSLEQPA
ncbi:hypothetical protein AGOR_G00015940 [Albula goreensis]|uniref:Uncharacterized protein n=1 Tax=Albula goreensis TaxID=1534307 RepID=A0A8T3EAH7_9TELE|nr:hypothetical protein AGOR_G00015940 [Albula goreensis]